MLDYASRTRNLNIQSTVAWQGSILDQETGSAVHKTNETKLNVNVYWADGM